MGTSSISAGLPRRIPASWPPPGIPAQHGRVGPTPVRPPDAASLAGPEGPLRWCKVLAARAGQADRVRDLIAELIAERPDRAEIARGASALATTAIRQAASTGHDFFITEVGWSGQVVLIATAAVADSGEVAGPVFGAQFDLEPGDGLAASPAPPLPGPFVPAQAADLEWRYPAWRVWFGEATREWWAMPRQRPERDQLISAPTAEALAGRLCSGRDGPGWPARAPARYFAS
ncbi:MAG TPA: hypothetical protein VK586_07005 [Streptosporangiaceae bacterium]|nr:hypothetical protein [Streptosporangiaceae bacterium]